MTNNSTWTRVWGIKVDNSVKAGDVLRIANKDGIEQEVLVNYVIEAGSNLQRIAIPMPTDDAIEAAKVRAKEREARELRRQIEAEKKEKRKLELEARENKRVTTSKITRAVPASTGSTSDQLAQVLAMFSARLDLIESKLG